MLLRVLSVGGAAFFLFLPLDLYVRASLYPQAPAMAVALWRVVGTAIIYATWVVVRARPLTERGLLLAGACAMTLSLLALAMLSLELGGLASSYLFAPAFYAVGMSTFLPTHWRSALLMAAPAILVFLGAILAGVALSPTLRPQFEDPRAIAEFIQNTLRIIGVVAFAGVSGHILWRARVSLRDANRLGRYLLKHMIGKGGMNEVWLAWDTTLKRDVALKLLHQSHPNDTRKARFEREARATSGLHSPNTVKVFDFGTGARGTLWMAMEYLRGMDLDKMIATYGPLDPRRAVHFARQAAAALAEAHQRGLVHRDIKPANLMALSDEDRADFLKVLDFGIARQVDALEASLTMVGMVVGTPAFMSPEMMAGATPDPRGDIWSFGATLYAMLTGTLPFDPAAYSRHGTARRRLVPPSERLGRPLPERLDGLVMRCMDLDAERRPEHGAALVEALQALPVAPWTLDDARAWWAEHTPTLMEQARIDDGTEQTGAAFAPTAPEPPGGEPSSPSSTPSPPKGANV